MKIVKISAITLAILIIVLFGGFWIWSQMTYEASDELNRFVGDDELIREDGVRFFPDSSNGTGVIIYPGARVDPEAYSLIGASLAEEGFTVFIPEMRFNLAFFEIGKADALIEEFAELEQWVIGGHSLGGVAAASYAYDKDVDGLFFYASYPQDSNDFSEQNLPMLSIYAERDGLTTLEDIDETSQLFSDEAVFKEIEGGNHAQFGVYGDQSGDRPATISVKEQQEEIIAATVRWLEEDVQ
ncbi:alpha/beta hydrolase [Salisediminibacterium halotolerans]|uniref:alpha/beta hydrolase n=1 Tax=Salisediminibacterium halotolerans TaxID=517425 RepID=UPI000F267DB5|nr:alpha/beta hydrolase [Salisediminibacterium halotolerans]RLJ75504.1 alpha/beta hydrolase family protein [Actinophytocola xinjiangensis]RPE89357.1 alpha/beta hydrolase family protein [Salisediminibacterium halotolerans]TWG36117.1 alpha/beta hydrolase family protein [Salisediminibacterium halotolerans]GEL08043.1 carboxymethylenebutenolidase [Salisediminibacterium halotolerans]